MVERRRWKRSKSQHTRAWIGPPLRRWADVIDTSTGGIRLALPETIGLGWPITIYRVWGRKLGPGRVGTIVHASGRSVGIRYQPDLAVVD